MRQISVILPVYNVEAYLDTAIRSVCDQTFTDWEMLLVDDGSTDGSGQICDRWAKADERIQVIRKANGGVSTARNAGLDAASGVYVFFLDPDDYLHPQTFEILLRLAEAHDAQIVPQYTVRTASGKQVQEYLYANDETTARFFGYNPTAVIGRLFARSLFRAIRFDPDARMAEDLTITPYLLDAARTVVSTDRRLYYVYHRPGSLTRKALHQEKAENLTKTVCRMYIDRLAFYRSRKDEGYARLLRMTYSIAFFDLLEKCNQFRAFPVCNRLLRRTMRVILRGMRRDRAADLSHLLRYRFLAAFPFVFSLVSRKKSA